VAIRAFGEDDPEWAGRPGYDLLLQHLGGGTRLTGFPGSPPTKHGSSIADLFAGCFAVQAILHALLARTSTGIGQRIIINMMQIQAQVLAYHASRYFVTGQVDQARGNAHAGIVPYDVFACLDGWFVIACANDAQWGRLRAALPLDDRPAWRTNAGRVADREAVDSAVAAAVRDKSTSDLDQLLVAADVPGGPVLDPAEALRHPTVQTVWMEHQRFGTIELPGPAYQASTTVQQHRAPPQPDQDRADILGGHGWAPRKTAAPGA
jgi:crotonobetainyl-CoA:carnitine CoA-transferase CaiB-like acyl-CoA transferase